MFMLFNNINVKFILIESMITDEMNIENSFSNVSNIIVAVSLSLIGL